MERLLREEIFIRTHFTRFQQLTERELEVLSFIASGYTNRQVSDQLFISEGTVKLHRKSIKKKTECRNTVELVKFAQSFDLI